MWKSRKKWEESLKEREYEMALAARKIEIADVLSTQLDRARQEIARAQQGSSDTRRVLDRGIYDLRSRRDALQVIVGTFDNIQKMRDEISQLEAKRDGMKRELLQTQEECSFLRGVVTEFAKSGK